MYSILSEYQAILDIATSLSLNKWSMRAFDMDLFRLHTGAPWPRCVLSIAISWLSCYAQAYRILSEYQAEYPAILDIATSLSLNKLFGNPRSEGKQDV